jgi:hypothetical protein
LDSDISLEYSASVIRLKLGVIYLYKNMMMLMMMMIIIIIISIIIFSSLSNTDVLKRQLYVQLKREHRNVGKVHKLTYKKGKEIRYHIYNKSAVFLI